MNRTTLRSSLYGGFAIASFLLIGCQNPLQAPDRGTATEASEGPYCGSAQTSVYSGATTTVGGTASFAYRATDFSGGACSGLCGAPKILGIPYAEVHIVDAAGTVLQCGETDASGNFSLVIPKIPGSYTAQILSRSFTNKIKVSVLEDIYSATPYTISTGFAISNETSITGLTPTARARLSEDPKLSGGAFNILADIYWANQFLRASSGNASFVADKATVFWKAGFNPYAYFNRPDDLISFYIAAQDRLFILGGKNGDVKVSDTDHFDDSVIIHEYGHFLEAHYGHSDSLGGSHNGNFIIDPRLSWSEGWGNYFQAAVLDNVVYAAGTGPKGTSGFKYYIDTVGYSNDPVEGSGTGAGIVAKIDLTEAAATAIYDRPGPNEGIFREFSITRTLFKTLRAAVPFQKIWETFTAMHDTTTPSTPLHKFMNFGLFNEILNAKLTDATQNSNWSSIISEENQKKDLSLYGALLTEQVPGSSPVCPAITMSPVVDRTYGPGDIRSNLLMSNDFYVYQHDGSSKVIKFITSSAGVEDLNLYVYADGYRYSEENEEAQAGFSNPTLVRTSKTLNVSSNSEIETVDMSGLPAGVYMINVKASTLNKTSAALSSSVNYYLYTANGNAVSKCLVPTP